MAIEPLLNTLGVKNPKRQNVGFNFAPQLVGGSPNGQYSQQSSPMQNLIQNIDQRKQGGTQAYQQGRAETTNRVAADIAGKSAFNIPVDEFGRVDQKLTDFRPLITQQLGTTRRIGQTALQTEEAKTQFQMAKTLQDLGQYQFSGQFQVTPSQTPIVTGNGANIPGASQNNLGAQAVDLAMKAFQNGTPYVWGGNSLTKGVDCSGLVQQIYRQLGIEIPRQTYSQAKHGKPVPINQLRPGDLVFFNTGSADPNGIGTYGHVGLYIGNGQMIDARGTKSGIKKGNMNIYGGPSLAIRPY